MKGLSIKHKYCELFVVKVPTFMELKPSFSLADAVAAGLGPNT